VVVTPSPVVLLLSRTESVEISVIHVTFTQIEAERHFLLMVPAVIVVVRLVIHAHSCGAPCAGCKSEHQSERYSESRHLSSFNGGGSTVVAQA
jgi:hypothetical protein